VSDVDVEGFVLNVDGGSMQELDYNKVHITERWINTQGESASQAQEDRWEGRDSTKYAQERMYKGCCRGSTKYTTRTE
jgi:hypothetical protein